MNQITVIISNNRGPTVIIYWPGIESSISQNLKPIMMSQLKMAS